MKSSFACIALSAAIAFALPAHAAEPRPDRVDHFQAKQADNVAEAVANLREANAKLAELLAGDVNDYAMQDIHSLSYTVEESLARIIDELKMLLDTAGDMHFATEGLKRDAVIDYGDAYLSGVRKIID
ncbi:MAG TPA: hypothetical protein PLR02_12100 [Rhodocyclaceae bacterium]|nr:hypothetical protein [Zoogloeaceae bacterium]HRD34986.1 hypothetical protein [Rhodocyclaceae bacterium]